MASSKPRTPGFRLLLVILVGLLLAIPLLAVYGLVFDRQSQSETARNSIAAGWGGSQVLAGPVLVIPYSAESVETETINGRPVSRTVVTERELFLSPDQHRLATRLRPEVRAKSIYTSVLYSADMVGSARFALPADLPRYGVARAALRLDRAEIRFGIRDSRGLQSGATATLGGRPVALLPGKGLNATGGSGFFGFANWDGEGELELAYRYRLHGSRSLGLVPRGGSTDWTVESRWPHPSFVGNFLPAERRVSGDGFTARWGVPNLALGQALVLTEDPGEPSTDFASPYSLRDMPADVGRGSSVAVVTLFEPVDLYAQVNRAVKYGFLFIGFTFLAFLMFDIVGGARVATAEYLLTGAGLVLFFVLLLAFAEVTGFTAAYLIAAGAIIGLLTAYSAAVLSSRRRALFIGALLVALYALLFVLLNLEAYSLLIGSVLVFAALAAVMYATRAIDWSAVRSGDETGVPGETEGA
jgi:inner membrane protein